ncbi:MAG: hypothetical protein J6D30_00735 [Clostridia bacterium]|nr:hypothetical protein [Clostridia bacterium]
MSISIQYSENLTCAAEELYLFLTTYTKENVLKNGENTDRSICLRVDKGIPEQDYSIFGDGKTLTVLGGRKSSVLCGVYDALADAGILFEATGHSVPQSFCLDTFFHVHKEVKPKFRLRGIRQHINFPMDVSSYHLEDAKAYIRSLARMRYNAITFHSYPGQWHEVDTKGRKDYAGHFFYGKVYPVPQADRVTASRVRNKKIHCIPEVEAVFENEAERGEYAKYWLNALMQTAKDLDMTLTLSVEVTFDEEDAIIDMLRSVCQTYPLIDTLELISEECGGFREMPELNRENIKAFMVQLFDKDVLDAQGNLPGLPDFMPHQLGAAAISVKRVLTALGLKDIWLNGVENRPALRAGIYTTCGDTLRILRPILRNRLPKDMTLSLLPAHGALAVADQIEKTGTISSDWQNTMFYSWAEFDGNMFLQQMSTDGIEKLVQLPDSDSSYGFCINHWRTSENNLTISYAAEAAITAMPAMDFYQEYAKKIGITNTVLFAKTCKKLAALDTYNRDELFNIGFCAIMCWLNWCRKGDAIMPRGYSAEKQTCSIAKYEEILADFKNLLSFAEKKEGIAFLRLMINRCQTSVLHIRALMALDEIKEIYDYDCPQPLTSEQRQSIVKMICRSRNYAEEYLHLYGELLPDRGCEGQLVSYYHTTIAFIDAVAATFIEDKKVLTEEDYDAPPMPDAKAK